MFIFDRASTVDVSEEYDGLFVSLVLFESCIIIIWQNATGFSPSLL